MQYRDRKWAPSAQAGLGSWVLLSLVFHFDPLRVALQLLSPFACRALGSYVNGYEILK
jgi:hypothetical protein